MEHVNGWCFHGIYKGGLWEDDLHVSAHIVRENTLRQKLEHYGNRYFPLNYYRIYFVEKTADGKKEGRSIVFSAPFNSRPNRLAWHLSRSNPSGIAPEHVIAL